MKTILNKEQSRHLCSLGCKFPNNIAIHDNNGEFYVSITIIDLLEILPKEIDNRLCINIEWNFITEAWGVNYDFTDSSYFFAEELIDSLYQLACWYYGEYLKSEKK